MAGLVLTACATGQREDGPAPVLQVTPREPVVAEAEPAAPPAPEQPAAPKKQQTRVFAYRDPAAEPAPAPPPEPAAAAPSVAQTPVQPAPAAKPAATPAPSPTQAPTQAKATPPAPAPAAAKPPTPAPPAPKVAQTPPKPEAKAPPTPPAPDRAQAPPPPPAPAPAAPPPAPPVQVAAIPPAPPLAAPGLPPAADALARQAEQQRQSGDYAGAAASLERSLRIAPREAYLWNRLARVRLEQGQAAQAGNLASRSNDLAGDTPNVKQDNWRVIAESKRRAGDIAGATEAEKRASGN
ncbi:tetratricopeptide repeat protein [Thiocapsa rosea]|nr:tetratricopeptide repeat protein [Thiocapsa rosea]